MKIMLVLASVMLTATASAPAHATVPQLNHRCPAIGAGMFSDADGHVYVNSEQAVVKAIDATHYTATIPGIVISITVNPDGSPNVSYASKGQTGACRAIPPPSEDNG